MKTNILLFCVLWFCFFQTAKAVDFIPAAPPIYYGIYTSTSDSLFCGLFFSEQGEGSANNKYLEIYNPGNQPISLDDYAYPNVLNGQDSLGYFDHWNVFPEGAVIEAQGVYLIAHPLADSLILAKADAFYSLLSNGDDCFALVKGSPGQYEVLDLLGDLGPDPGSGWSVAGINNASLNHRLLRKASVGHGNDNWLLSAGTDADNSEWEVGDPDDWSSVGSHVFNGLCAEVAVQGCMDVRACNYTAAATQDNGLCEYLSCQVDGGCLYTAAVNYNPHALADDGTCVFEVLQGAGFCGAGTFWDASAGLCKVIGVYPCATDLDGDQHTGVGDLLLFLSLYGQACQTP